MVLVRRVLEESEFESDVLGDAVDREGGVPDEVDFDVSGSGRGTCGGLDFSGQGAGDGAGGGCEGHGDFDAGVGVDVYAVDEAEVVDVDGDFGIVDGADGLDDLAFEKGP